MEDYKFNNLMQDDLTLYGNKIILRYSDQMATEQGNILKEYAEKTKSNGEMFYIYNVCENHEDLYLIRNCKTGNRCEVIVKAKEELPDGAELGSVLRKKGDSFELDADATKAVNRKINAMIKEKIEEQKQFLESRRAQGHIYQVGEKYSGRIWLYDLNNIEGGGITGIEEIEFPTKLYEDAKEGEKFIYKDGEYQKL